MKWFKHISDSLDDPFIFDLMAQHGDAGYVIFFGILEIYAREFHPEPGWKLTISWDYLRSKLHRTRNKQIENILRSIQIKNKWEIVLTNLEVSIYIPKFKELLDDWTTRKVSKVDKDYVVATEKLQHQADKEKDKEKDIILSSPNGHCPHTQIIELYHMHLPMMPGVKTWTEKRKKFLNARWKQAPEQTLEWWENFFKYISGIKFLTEPSKTGWRCDLEWIITESNFVKIRDGRYE